MSGRDIDKIKKDLNIVIQAIFSLDERLRAVEDVIFAVEGAINNELTQ